MGLFSILAGKTVAHALRRIEMIRGGGSCVGDDWARLTRKG